MGSVEISGFSATQILREINCGHFEAPKTAIFDHLRCFEFFGKYWHFKYEILPKFKAYRIVETAVFDLMKPAKINFT